MLTLQGVQDLAEKDIEGLGKGRMTALRCMIAQKRVSDMTEEQRKKLEKQVEGLLEQQPPERVN